jgi:hypothetical protein
MTPFQPIISARSVPASLFGLLLLAVYGVVVELMFGWTTLARSLLAVGLAPAALVAAGVVASYVLRALRIRAAGTEILRARLLDVTRVFALHNLSNWLLPARLGEASLPLLLQRRYGMPLSRGAGVLLWLRAIDLHVIGLLAGTVLVVQFHGSWRYLGALVWGAGLLLPWLCLRVLPRLTRRWPLAQKLTSVMPGQFPAIVSDLALGWAAWTVKLAALGAALSQIAGLPYAAGVLGALGGDISGVMPLHAPLGAGSYEAGVMIGLTPWQPELKAALAAAVQLHVLVLAAVLALGALALPSLARAPHSLPE